VIAFGFLKIGSENKNECQSIDKNEFRVPLSSPLCFYNAALKPAGALARATQIGRSEIN
jgi:hypothetical protein